MIRLGSVFASMDSAHIRCVVPTSQHRPTSSISRLAYFEIHSFRTIRGPVPLPNVELHWTEFISHRRPVCNGHRQMNIEPMWKATIFLIFSIFFILQHRRRNWFNIQPFLLPSTALLPTLVYLYRERTIRDSFWYGRMALGRIRSTNSVYEYLPVCASSNEI